MFFRLITDCRENDLPRFLFTFHTIFYITRIKTIWRMKVMCTLRYINKDRFITITQACYLQKSEAVSLTSIEMSNQLLFHRFDKYIPPAISRSLSKKRWEQAPQSCNQQTILCIRGCFFSFLSSLPKRVVKNPTSNKTNKWKLCLSD